jgi:RHS repeat-associated protein
MATYNRTYAGESPQNLTMSFSLVERPIYGSSRIANFVDSVQLVYLEAEETEFSYPDDIEIFEQNNGTKHFELTNHLGNVMAVVTDKRLPILTGTYPDEYIATFQPELLIAKDYYPFGMEMSGRYDENDPEDLSVGYRYGFNGQEKDDEWTGQTGSHLNFKYRMYDARIGRFFAIDPLSASYPYNSTYAFCENRVINSFDFEGLEAVVGINMGGDVEYRKGHLAKLHAGAIEESIYSPQTPTDPKESLKFVQILSNATANDPMHEIGFLAWFGHGRNFVVYGDYESPQHPNKGAIVYYDLQELQTAIDNKEIVFGENSVIFVSACNFGTDFPVYDDNYNLIGYTSYAQELANMTGSSVVAARTEENPEFGGVSPISEISGVEMIFGLSYPKKASYYSFEKDKSPYKLGTSFDVGRAINTATTPKEEVPEKMERLKVSTIN